MKKILLSMLLIIPMLTGCANVDTKITINDDKSAAIATSVSYAGDLGDKNDLAAVLISDNFSKYLGTGYKVQKAFNSRLSTIIATKQVRDLTTSDLDLSSFGAVSNLPGGKFIELRKSFLVKSFNVDFTYDYSKEAKKYASAIENSELPESVNKQSSLKGLSPEYYQKYAEQEDVDVSNNDFVENLDETVRPQPEQKDKKADEKDGIKNNAKTPLSASISIQIPSLAFSNNADTVAGNLYTWNIKQDGPTRVKLQYVQYSGWAITFMLLAGILILILGAKKIVKHENQKRIGNSDNIVE